MTFSRTVVYLASALLLVLAAFLVFRVLVRRDYRRRGRLTPVSSALELLIWALFVGFPYLYNPPEWVWFWRPGVPVGPLLRSTGIICITAGLLSAFGTMIWFGLRRAVGLEVSGLVQSGPYRLSRNPQLVGGSLLIVGTVTLWPSWYAAGWAILYGAIGHLMVLTEEEHLRAVYRDEYDSYCARVPQYVGWGARRQSTAG
jgi:protein-S-isoprenylcysteine O-methyltransferase Ste14